MWQIFWRFLHNWYVFPKSSRKILLNPSIVRQSHLLAKTEKNQTKRLSKDFQLHLSVVHRCPAVPTAAKVAALMTMSMSASSSTIKALLPPSSNKCLPKRYRRSDMLNNTLESIFFSQSSKSLSNFSQNRPIRTNFEYLSEVGQLSFWWNSLTLIGRLCIWSVAISDIC